MMVNLIITVDTHDVATLSEGLEAQSQLNTNDFHII